MAYFICMLKLYWVNCHHLLCVCVPFWVPALCSTRVMPCTSLPTPSFPLLLLSQSSQYIQCVCILLCVSVCGICTSLLCVYTNMATPKIAMCWIHRQPGSHVHMCRDPNVLSSAIQVETEKGKCLCMRLSDFPMASVSGTRVPSTATLYFIFWAISLPLSFYNSQLTVSWSLCLHQLITLVLPYVAFIIYNSDSHPSWTFDDHRFIFGLVSGLPAYLLSHDTHHFFYHQSSKLLPCHWSQTNEDIWILSECSLCFLLPCFGWGCSV